MSVDEPFNIYREQLSSLYHGLALWDPQPVEHLHKQPDHISISDVGYLDNGTFIRMFNVTLPWDDSSNRLLRKPEKYEHINPGDLGDVLVKEIREGEYCTPHVYKEDDMGTNTHEESLGQTYQCRAQHRGAFLFLPHKGHRKDVLPMNVFKDYIRDNVENWFRWSKKMKLPVEQMEDLILVTACTLVTSWATAAFERNVLVDSDATKISLEARKSNNGGAEFVWRNIRGPVEYHNSPFDPNVQERLPLNQCVFIRGFRAKRTFFRNVPMRAEAEPLPDDPDCRQGETQVTRIPDGPKYRDPLVGILDYIIQKCNEDSSAAEDIIAIAHDDDLRLIRSEETLTADSIEEFLNKDQMPLLIENGAAILHGPADNEPPVSLADEEKSSFTLISWAATLISRAVTLISRAANFLLPMDYSKTFCDELAIQYPGLGGALWGPDPGRFNTAVQVGDVGFIFQGRFYRLFNALLPRAAPLSDLLSESDLRIPDHLQRLQPRMSNHIRTSTDHRRYFCSKNVTNASSGANIVGLEDFTRVTFSCSERQGAVLYLPFPAEQQDTAALEDFRTWIMDNIDDCMDLAEKLGWGVTDKEDIIIVTGRHMARSWARAVFENPGSAVSFLTQLSPSRSSVSYVEDQIVSGARLEFGPSGENLLENQCIFIRGYRVSQGIVCAL